MLLALLAELELTLAALELTLLAKDELTTLLAPAEALAAGSLAPPPQAENNAHSATGGKVRQQILLIAFCLFQNPQHKAPGFISKIYF